MSEISRLYGLDPLEMNAASIESLNHYLVRSAEEHSLDIKDLMCSVIFTVMPQKPMKSFVQENISRIGANCPLTEETVKAVESLTHQQNISKMTFIPYHHIISNSNLVRKYNAWCANCYENPKTRYDTLLSTLQVNELCPNCYEPLVSNCPFEDCNKPFYALARHRVCGFCPHCKRFLGEKSFYKQTILVENLDYQISITKNLAELVENWETAHLCSKEYLFRASDLYIQKFIFRSTYEFCRRVSIPNQAYKSFQNDNRRIPLRVLLNMAIEMNVSVFSLISGSAIEIIENRPVPLSTLSTHRTGYASKEYLKQGIKKYLDNNNLSLKQIAKNLGVSYNTLKRHCPDEYEAIRDRNQGVGTFSKTELSQILQDLIDDPLDQSTIEDIASRIGCSVHFLRENFPEEYERIQEHRKVEVTHKSRKPKSIDVIRAEFLELLVQEINPPLRLYQVVQRIGTTFSRLKNELPDLCQRLEKQQEDYANQELLNLRLQFETLSKEYPPLSLSQITLLMGQERRKLEELFPELCKLVKSNYKNPDISKINQALQEAAVAEPPISVHSLSQSLNYPITIFYAYYRELCEQITIRYWAYYRISPELAQQLENYLSEDFNPPLSLATIASNLGYDTKTLRSYFPEICASLVNRFETYRSLKAKERLDAVKTEVYEAMLRIIKNGEYPNRSRVGRNLSKSSTLTMLDPEIKAYHAQLLRDFGFIS